MTALVFCQTPGCEAVTFAPRSLCLACERGETPEQQAHREMLAECYAPENWQTLPKTELTATEARDAYYSDPSETPPSQWDSSTNGGAF